MRTDGQADTTMLIVAFQRARNHVDRRMALIQERDKLIPVSQVSVKNLKLFEDEEVYPKNV